MKDMTQGNPVKEVLLFSVPMILASVFQQMYNAVDSIIVGQFVGANALAAVGAAFPAMFLAMSVLIGITMGVQIIISQLFGAGEHERMRATFATSIISLMILVVIASVIGQYLSALLVVIHLLRRTDDCGLHPSRLRLDPACGKAILVLGIPTGIQNAIFAIANLFVQSGVNSFDAVMVSGNAAAANADTLIFNIMAAFYTGCSSFIGQNWGAGNRERMKKSYLVGLTYSFAAGAIFGGLLLIFGRQFLSLFATEPAVIDAGMQRVKIMGFSYMISAFMDCSIAASRGIGKSIVPMVIVILGSCVFRVIWVYTIFVWIHTIPALYSLYFFSWAITSVAEVLYFRHSFRQLEFQS